ncbi:MAG: 16S rRNA (adenine(1518)-N(6)/adenine(1519)-N(6))-dimethyltransferase RsmA [Candidatus Thermoplasmatota archaeon]|nr:ribosomal RNA small subunit methyltransferase A [Euryarchaeota archaeon]MBU4032096.1 ribosomal RNA small subunit methyltransferase A [Candidatus Thermoplasmatota archaeon]MBU4072285.1 ribosomal RNA small subunit methyltransferase A [Candidatus Thermoplasmatota archaeon]MBU4144324.1 ribosomal RNA small subunit methyltransferase A [Candidatus Thermoplasmatota archaeon]MBU4592586.1 16S rRNA (adenine(1518)-N(6)/adenine(1519)-N(6))-dimethyltransferase RsmA [Candidatus Thermoplasmatota archaeon]
MTGKDPASELKKLGIRPSKSMGQNFLVDGGIADWIVAQAEIRPHESVLEIGPGLGILTRRLANLTDNLTVVELDRRLADKMNAMPGVHVIQGDILEVTLPELDKVVSNLPYQISSPVTLRLLEHGFSRAVLMFQKEFAEHLVAGPGEPAYSRISVMVGYRAETRILKHVGKGSFYPVPKVDSAVVSIIPRKPDFTILDENHFSETVRILFSHKNRKVRNGIMSEHAALRLDKTQAREIGDILPHNDKRPITLSPAQLAEISNVLVEKGMTFPRS